jgi:hypothetical protein
MSDSRIAGAKVVQRIDTSKDKPRTIDVVCVSQVDWLPCSPVGGLHGIVRPCEGGLLYIHEYRLQAESLVLDPARMGWANYLLMTSLVPERAYWLDMLAALWSFCVEPCLDDWRYPLFAHTEMAR